MGKALKGWTRHCYDKARWAQRYDSKPFGTHWTNFKGHRQISVRSRQGAGMSRRKSPISLPKLTFLGDERT